MKIEFVAKNYSVNQKLKETLDKKIAKLDKFFEIDAKCRVYLKVENKICKMEISLYYRDSIIRAEAKAENFYDAIDFVLPKLEKQIIKHRSKLESKLKKGSIESLTSIPDYEDFKLVKTKNFEISPQTVDDAIIDFELKGYNFYVFSDIDDNNKIKVLYLRDDGNVGLIDAIITKWFTIFRY